MAPASFAAARAAPDSVAMRGTSVVGRFVVRMAAAQVIGTIGGFVDAPRAPPPLPAATRDLRNTRRRR
jgi:hypothetical protein